MWHETLQHFRVAADLSNNPKVSLKSVINKLFLKIVPSKLDRSLLLITWSKKKPSGGKLRWNKNWVVCHNDQQYVWRQGETFNSKITITTVKDGSGSIMMSGIFAAIGSGVLKKVNGIIKMKKLWNIGSEQLLSLLYQSFIHQEQKDSPTDGKPQSPSPSQLCCHGYSLTTLCCHGYSLTLTRGPCHSHSRQNAT